MEMYCASKAQIKSKEALENTCLFEFEIMYSYLISSKIPSSY